ncbi:MAG TPA: nucleotide exchange factor GrpE [Candidatus Coproplasma avicola]|uniref:Protein GrpE n=1 Tax=Candidatus Coproplasma avicola TaxID=2840744 RepID=A0A9D1E4V9_9FIRM|nr:nucleotide exchange factor GrpE [Candidatus Coproplasma avicola]
MAENKDELKHSDEEELLDAPTPEEEAEGKAQEEQESEKTPPEPSELEKALAAAEDYRRKWYSVSAEYDNFRKRNQSAVSQAYADGKAEAILKLLPVADNFGYAYEGAPDEKTKTGIDKIIKSFNTILSSLGVEEIVINVGDSFDESCAEAIMNVPAGEGETPNTVQRVLKKGYKQGEKVIRFAQVIVSI